MSNADLPPTVHRHMDVLVQFLKVFMCRYAVSKGLIAKVDMHYLDHLSDDSVSVLAKDVMRHQW